ncbi:MAG: decarboxylating 6-phosphogluconate dehydrogenase [Deltaproteobacteria bacterium]|nr:decarboxylating 6-phosphogluconate dehydrogenase [Deltaproteobacteria bacterium]MBT8358948.1 decarboxylating 6-phosphogluconate dehydrogenase [Deltaproteobacteria bacterium]NNK84848.1 decarboxylating 6-phosphogluconate dehydrogenase [Desulfobacterales bacterium]NNL41655.1 decarboxylating 6-phosphogluconate dehydrogenase [Desulfobacterales bacterium]
MQVAIIGLGRMGMNMAKRLLLGGHEVIAFNRTPAKTKQVVQEGAIGAYSISEVVDKLSTPRVIWIMLPAGSTVDEHINKLNEFLSPDDIVIDGGNTYYKDDIRRGGQLAKRGIKFLDAGVSGGIWGLEEGYCLMIGGEKQTYQYVEPIFNTLAPENGYLYCGEIGAGHFVKMVHNGIEYGMMQAYGEGFDILQASPYSENFDYAAISHLWNQGSVVRSWLLELMESAFAKEPNLSDIRGYVEDSGEGRWTIQQAIETGVSAPVIALSLMRRFRSQVQDSFSDKVVAALRREFGGHATVAADKK